MQTIRFLLAIPKVAEAANSLNHNGFPALGVIEHSPRDLKRIEIRHVLVDPGVKSSANNLLNCIPPLTPPPLIASTHAAISEEANGQDLCISCGVPNGSESVLGILVKDQ